MRKVKPSERPCSCPAAAWPHRKGYCERGGARRALEGAELAHAVLNGDGVPDTTFDVEEFERSA